MLADYFSNY